MQEIIPCDINGDSICGLVQWDRNIHIYLKDEKIDKAYHVHFFNDMMNQAFVVESTYDNGVLSVKIPNDLLTQPRTITGYVAITGGEEESRCTLGFRITVRKKPKPSNFVHTESNDYILLDNIRNECKKFSENASYSAGASSDAAAAAAESAAISERMAESSTSKAAEASESASEANIYAKQADISARRAIAAADSISAGVIKETVIPTQGWTLMSRNPNVYYIDIIIEESKASHYPIAAINPDSQTTAQKAGLSAICETFDGYVRFTTANIPSDDISVTIMLLSLKNEASE